MKKFLFLAVVVCLSTGLSAAPALPWGSATHAYIGDRLNATTGPANLSEIYGAMAADLFNLVAYAGSDPGGILFRETHYFHYGDKTPTGLGELWKKATIPDLKATVYGVYSHNEEWAADRTAHISGITFGIGTGYVIAKKNELKFLANLLGLPKIPAEIGIDPELAYEIFVETGIDVLVWQTDKNIGKKIWNAAAMRNGGFPLLLSEVYAQRLEPVFGSQAAEIILYWENYFRLSMQLYGSNINPLDTREEVIEKLSTLLALQAVQIQGLNDPPPAELIALIEAYVKLSFAICSSPLTPAMREINSTIFGLRYLSPLFLYSRY